MERIIFFGFFEMCNYCTVPTFSSSKLIRFSSLTLNSIGILLTYEVIH